MTSPRASCAVCRHPRFVALDAAARVAAPSLEGRLAVAQEFDVTLAAVEKHLDRCKPPRAAKRAKRIDEQRVEEAPESGPREAVEATPSIPAAPEPPPLPPARELAAPDEELRRRAQLLTRHLEREDLEPRQVAQVSNALASIDRLVLARERSERPIDEHPAFEPLLEDLVAAVLDALGPRAPEGIEAEIAEAFERRQAERASGQALRRAA